MLAKAKMGKVEEVSLPYEIEEFRDSPGLYYEKIGNLLYTEEDWKLVIKLDFKELNTRYNQVKLYLKKTRVICEKAKLDGVAHKETCRALSMIAERDEAYLKKIINQIQTVYKKQTDRRRGLVDGLGSVAKALFGTMDADDEKQINEQLHLLENNQETLRHVTANQLKIINTTVAHMERMEDIINKNEFLLEQRIMEFVHIGEITAHFTIISAVTTDLIRDAENILDYLTHISEGILSLKVTPIENIIKHMVEIIQHLPQGTYFPFRVNSENWPTIQRYIKIKAYCDKQIIYTILVIPLVRQPNYEIINVNALPIPNYNNSVFAITNINNKIFAIDKEKLKYTIFSENELSKCIEVNTNYVCETSTPVYKVNVNAPCEILMFVQQNRPNKCKAKYIRTNAMNWIALRQQYTWLYSTASEQMITIQCSEQSIFKKLMKGIGKITLKTKCKLITPEMTVHTKLSTLQTDAKMYLPEYNLTLLQDRENITNEIDTVENIVQHKVELTKIKTKIEELKNNLQENHQNFLYKEHFIFPMVISGIFTIAIICAIVYIGLKIKNKKKEKRVTWEAPQIIYATPKPIARRRKSTAY